jgi:hypothetical protein
MQRYHARRRLAQQGMERELAAKVAQLRLLERDNARLRQREGMLETMVAEVDRQLELIATAADGGGGGSGGGGGFGPAAAAAAAAAASAGAMEWTTGGGVAAAAADGRLRSLSGTGGSLSLGDWDRMLRLCHPSGRIGALPTLRMLRVAEHVDGAAMTPAECRARWCGCVARLVPLLRAVGRACEAAHSAGAADQAARRAAADEAVAAPAGGGRRPSTRRLSRLRLGDPAAANGGPAADDDETGASAGCFLTASAPPSFSGAAAAADSPEAQLLQDRAAFGLDLARARLNPAYASDAALVAAAKAARDRWAAVCAEERRAAGLEPLLDLGSDDGCDFSSGGGEDDDDEELGEGERLRRRPAAATSSSSAGGGARRGGDPHALKEEEEEGEGEPSRPCRPRLLTPEGERALMRELRGACRDGPGEEQREAAGEGAAAADDDVAQRLLSLPSLGQGARLMLRTESAPGGGGGGGGSGGGGGGGGSGGGVAGVRQAAASAAAWREAPPGVPAALVRPVLGVVLRHFAWLLCIMVRNPTTMVGFITLATDDGAAPVAAPHAAVWSRVAAAMRFSPAQVAEMAACYRVTAAARARVVREREAIREALALGPEDDDGGGGNGGEAADPAGGAFDDDASLLPGVVERAPRPPASGAATGSAGGTGSGSTGSGSGAAAAARAIERQAAQLAAVDALQSNLLRELIVRNMVGFHGINVFSALQMAATVVAVWPSFPLAVNVVGAVEAMDRKRGGGGGLGGGGGDLGGGGGGAAGAAAQAAAAAGAHAGGPSASARGAPRRLSAKSSGRR